MYSTGLITTFSLISTWLIVATACMRYVSTFHPLQNHLDSRWSDGGGCVRAGCRGVSGRNRGCVVVVLTYVVCVLGNLPSFYLFRATPLSTAGLFDHDLQLTTTIRPPIRSYSPRRGLEVLEAGPPAAARKRPGS